MSVQKTSSLLVLATILAGFLVIAFLVTFLSFTPVEGTAGVTSLLGLAAIALFFTFAIDGILGALRKTLRIRPGALSYKGRGLSADVASGYKYGSILGNTFFLLFVCLVLGLILYTFIDNAILPAISQGSVAVRPASLVFLGTYASYPFLLRPVLRRLSAQLGGISTVSKVLPFYSLIPGGLTIDFKVKQFGGRPRSWIAKMGFDELDEVRQFNSYFEATAFLEYSVGPDVKMQVRRSVDLYRWAKGEISRPSVLVRIDSRRNPVLLNGKNIFYLISFQGNDVTDLVGAFHTFKESPTSISPS